MAHSDRERPTSENEKPLKIYYEIGSVVAKARFANAHYALLELEEYVDGTIIQYQRVLEALRNTPLGDGTLPRLDELFRQGRENELVSELTKRPLFLDWLLLDLQVHFFLVSIDKVQNLVEYIAEADGDCELRELWEEVRPKFKPFNDARNHFEHIELRIRDMTDQMGTGGLMVLPTGELQVRFRKKNQSWGSVDIDQKSVTLVRDTYERLQAILRARSA